MSPKPDRKLSTMDEVCEAIKKHRNFLLSAHIRPEGDSVGSLLAMKSLLTKLGKKARIVCQDNFPERLDIMPKDGWCTVAQIRRFKPKPVFDACIVVDCPNPGRIGTVRELIGPKTTIINIDHHVSNAHFGHYNLVQDRAAACGEIIYDLFKKLNVPITKEDALPIYVSISTDTGSFKYSNTTSKTHLVASELIQTGINLEEINENLYDRSSHKRLVLLADLLDKLKVEMNGKVVWAVVKLDMLKKTKATFEDTEGFIDFLRSMAGVCIAFILIENSNNKFQVSFRAKGPHDVNRIAEKFGGGGHRKAAGCTITGSADQASRRILSVIRGYLKKPTFSKSSSHE